MKSLQTRAELVDVNELDGGKWLYRFQYKVSPGFNSYALTGVVEVIGSNGSLWKVGDRKIVSVEVK